MAMDGMQVAGLLGSTLKGNGVGNLISGSSKYNSLTAMQNLLTSAYMDAPAVELDLSAGLGEFITQNVENQDTAASLLADLEAISKLSGASSGGDLVSSLLSAGSDDSENGGLLSLLI